VTIWNLYGVVWRMYFTTDKAPAQILRASAAWLSAPAPVDAITVVAT